MEFRRVLFRSERDGAVLVDLVIVDAVDAGTLDQAQEVLAAGRIDVDRAPVAGLPEAAVGFVAQQVAGIDVADAALELDLVPVHADRHVVDHVPDEADRSEEHTSELQSLMRISYAVFCLKKKNQKQH